MEKFGSEFQYFRTTDERYGDPPDVQLFNEFGNGAAIYIYESLVDDEFPFIYTDTKITDYQLQALEGCLRCGWETSHMTSKFANDCLKNREEFEEKHREDDDLDVFIQDLENAVQFAAWMSKQDLYNIEQRFLTWKEQNSK